jgi:hypothetical protein
VIATRALNDFAAKEGVSWCELLDSSAGWSSWGDP